MKISRSTGAGITLAVAALALTACGQPQAGAALTWDGGRITEAQVAQESDQLAEDLAPIVEAGNQQAPGEQLAMPENAALTSVTLNRLATNELVSLAAESAGVTVTEGQVDQELETLRAQYSGDAGLAAQAASAGIPANGIRAYVRRQLELTGVAQAIGATPGADGQFPPELAQYLAEVSIDSEFTANPRFGVWVPQQIAVEPDPDALSRPADNTEVNDLMSGLQQQ